MLTDFFLLHFDLRISGCLPVSSKDFEFRGHKVASICSCRDLKQGAYWPSRSKGPRQREGERGSQEIWELEGDECSLYLPGRVKALSAENIMLVFVCWKVAGVFGFQVFACFTEAGRKQEMLDSLASIAICSVTIFKKKIILICRNANSREKCGIVA